MVTWRSSYNFFLAELQSLMVLTDETRVSRWGSNVDYRQKILFHRTYLIKLDLIRVTPVKSYNAEERNVKIQYTRINWHKNIVIGQQCDNTWSSRSNSHAVTNKFISWCHRIRHASSDEKGENSSSTLYIQFLPIVIWEYGGGNSLGGRYVVQNDPEWTFSEFTCSRSLGWRIPRFKREDLTEAQDGTFTFCHAFYRYR